METTNQTGWWLAAWLAIYLFAASGCIPARRRLPVSLNEISGAVAVPGAAPELVAINDGGNGGVLWGIRADSYPLSASSFGDSLPNQDWEAIAYDSVLGELLVCDVGDNARAREFVTVYRISRTGDLIAEHRLRYPDRPHDCEACLYRDGVVTLITKDRALRGERERVAYVFTADLGAFADTLQAIDSFRLRRRSVTDAARLADGRLVLLAYDFRLLGPLPLERTSLHIGTPADFRAGIAWRRPIRSPLALAQYETLVLESSEWLWLASERTLLWPARWRRVRLAGRSPKLRE